MRLQIKTAKHSRAGIHERLGNFARVSQIVIPKTDPFQTNLETTRNVWQGQYVDWRDQCVSNQIIIR
ncbi:hypothetical protein ROLI_027080 [Roseobacter fucihabitans]|uniref:Uncharacterized protein n=1 Tax=Roseobacter fucihabitans TaxID=1537242 RepID=A0ABZ2BW65_9RHOB|nr:hypothetical protein [Roseobacter litoralis]